MSNATLLTERRSDLGSRPAGRGRRAGRIPAVVYGLAEDNQHVTVDARDLGRIFASDTGANTLITLTVDGAEQLVLARQIQRNPVRGGVTHVDFVRVRADEEIQAEVPLRLVGEAAGVVEGGVLDQVLFSLTVVALPTAIPASFEVDITSLDIGGQLRVEVIASPAGVTVLQDPDTLVASIVAPSEEIIEEEVPEELLEGELVEGELVEGEPVEGEAPSEDAESEGADESE